MPGKFGILACTMGKRTPTSARKVHLHIENSLELDRVFECSRARLRAALARKPEIAARARITVGYGGDILERSLRTCDALFCWKIDFARIEQRAPRLKWIHIHGAGIEHLRPLHWLPRGVRLSNSRGVHGRRAVEYAAMAILMLNNRVPELVTHQRARRWQQCFNSNVEGKSLLIVGVGHLGGGVARWAKGMGMRVIGVRRSAARHRYVDEMHGPEKLSKLLPGADFVMVSAPLTDATRHLIGASELARLKRGAGLLNFGRAEVVDYEALRAKLERGELSAVLDVFDPEPLPRSSPLWTTPNLIITPHCGSDDSNYYAARTLDILLDNLERFMDGRRLVNLVSRKYQY